MPERFLPAGHPVLQSGLELDTIIGGISIYSIR
jgi:hypothetical protein